MTINENNTTLSKEEMVRIAWQNCLKAGFDPSMRNVLAQEPLLSSKYKNTGHIANEFKKVREEHDADTSDIGAELGFVGEQWQTLLNTIQKLILQRAEQLVGFAQETVEINDELVAQYNALQEQYQALKSEFDATAKAHETLTNDLENIKTASANELKGKDDEIAAIKSEVDSLKNDIKTLQDGKTDHDDEIAKRDTRISELDQQALSHMVTIQTQEKTIDQLIAQLAQQSEQIAELKTAPKQRVNHVPFIKRK